MRQNGPETESEVAEGQQMNGNEVTPLRVGYARLPNESSDEDERKERSQLTRLGCDPHFIFIERGSVKLWRKERPVLQQALKTMSRGDQFVITDFNRLAGSVHELAVLLLELRQFGRELIVGMWNIDTRAKDGWQWADYLGPLMAFESAVRKELQREGIEKAKAEGRYKGREPVTQKRSGEVLALRSQGLTIATIARQLAMGEATVFRIIKAAREAEQSEKGSGSD